MNTDWEKLSPLQLGQFGEYYAKMEFASYGYEVYTSEVDDHGVDFIAKKKDTGVFYEVQVKSQYKGKYPFVKKDKLVMDDHHLVCFLHFFQNQLPVVYIIPATAWNHPNAALVDRTYCKPGQTSKPEWGISLAKKNLPLIEKYKAEKFLQK